MPLCTDYSSTRDCFSYILLGYPDFPGNKSSTPQSVFADIVGGVKALAARTSNPDALALFEQCLSEIAETFRLFSEGQDLNGRKQIRRAQETFIAAGKLRKTKHAASDKIEEDYQS